MVGIWPTASCLKSLAVQPSQTMLQMFKTCTIHKMTHLYASDVITEGVANLPNNWHLWRSKMSDEFTNMTNSFLSEVTGRSSIPDHAMLISNMSTNKGGLGLQHPRCTAIPTLVLNMKRCIGSILAPSTRWLTSTHQTLSRKESPIYPIIGTFGAVKWVMDSPIWPIASCLKSPVVHPSQTTQCWLAICRQTREDWAYIILVALSSPL